MCEYGFEENKDFATVDKNVLRADGSVMPQIQHKNNHPTAFRRTKVREDCPPLS